MNAAAATSWRPVSFQFLHQYKTYFVISRKGHAADRIGVQKKEENKAENSSKRGIVCWRDKAGTARLFFLLVSSPFSPALFVFLPFSLIRSAWVAKERFFQKVLKLNREKKNTMEKKISRPRLCCRCDPRRRHDDGNAPGAPGLRR